MIEISQAALVGAVLAPAVGMAVFNLMAVVRGWLIPRATHEREIRILEESNAKVVASHLNVVAELQSRIADKTTEIGIWRTVATTEQASTVELLAQHRMSLETNRATVYAIEGFRDGLVRAQKETQT
jgi:hypothetical protein